MWEPYLKVVREKCSQALNILDRFHIVARMNKALDEVRAAEYRRMAQTGFEPVLKKSRWCLLKRKENLTGKQKGRLRELLQFNLKTVRAYLLKAAFQQLCLNNAQAHRNSGHVCQRDRCSRIVSARCVSLVLVPLLS
jgi:transposase